MIQHFLFAHIIADICNSSRTYYQMIELCLCGIVHKNVVLILKLHIKHGITVVNIKVFHREYK